MSEKQLERIKAALLAGESLTPAEGRALLAELEEARGAARAILAAFPPTKHAEVAAFVELWAWLVG